jgi:hypothetical protein
MKKEQFLTLLNKIKSSVDDTPLSEWPGSVTCEMTQDMTTLTKLEFNTNKCHIIMWTDWSVRKLCVKFKVNSSVIESYYPVPRWGLRWTSPVWRSWKSLSRLINKKHKKVEELKREKSSEEQIEIFNNFFYNSFPEEIDDILFNKDDD